MNGECLCRETVAHAQILSAPGESLVLTEEYKQRHCNTFKGFEAIRSITDFKKTASLVVFVVVVFPPHKLRTSKMD